LHDALDQAVAKAYGWSWPEPPALVLERLVVLHDQRVREEEDAGIRWLRPDDQPARAAVGDVVGAVPAFDLVAITAVPAGADRRPSHGPQMQLLRSRRCGPSRPRLRCL
jgi:hypothetical protein